MKLLNPIIQTDPLPSMANDDQTPANWWLTAYQRSFRDFTYFASVEKPFFRDVETLSGLSEQRRRLSKSLEIYTLISFLGASMVIAGGLPSDSTISFFGIQGPGRLVTIPLLSALVAMFFARYWQALISITMLTNMLDHIVGEIVPDAQEFVTARFDGSFLWASLMRSKEIGYQSSGWHKSIKIVFASFGLIWMLLHSTVVIFATYLSCNLSWNSDGFWSWSFMISVLALTVSVFMVLYFVLGFLVPLPYRMSEDMKTFLENEKKEKPAMGEPMGKETG